MSQRERPILFSGPLVRAILAGTKTVTRRPVKPQPRNPEVFKLHAAFDVPCPFGAPGDRLWGRETFYVNHIDYVRGELPKTRPIELTDAPVEILYRADGDFDAHFEQIDAPELAVWRPSLHMPRWASRILLEVTDVRVERLQEITEEDARAEGVEPLFVVASLGTPHRNAFRATWDQIYGAGSWDANGWVWRIAFKRVEVPRG